METNQRVNGTPQYTPLYDFGQHALPQGEYGFKGGQQVRPPQPSPPPTAGLQLPPQQETFLFLPPSSSATHHHHHHPPISVSFSTCIVCVIVITWPTRISLSYFQTTKQQQHQQQHHIADNYTSQPFSSVNNSYSFFVI